MAVRECEELGNFLGRGGVMAEELDVLPKDGPSRLLACDCCTELLHQFRLVKVTCALPISSCDPSRQ